MAIKDYIISNLTETGHRVRPLQLFCLYGSGSFISVSTISKIAPLSAQTLIGFDRFTPSTMDIMRKNCMGSRTRRKSPYTSLSTIEADDLTIEWCTIPKILRQGGRQEGISSPHDRGGARLCLPLWPSLSGLDYRIQLDCHFCGSFS